MVLSGRLPPGEMYPAGEADVRARPAMHRERHAHVAARRRFGNQTSLQQRSRDMWGLGGLDRFRQDLRYAVRGLRATPGLKSGPLS